MCITTIMYSNAICFKSNWDMIVTFSISREDAHVLVVVTAAVVVAVDAVVVVVDNLQIVI